MATLPNQAATTTDPTGTTEVSFRSIGASTNAGAMTTPFSFPTNCYTDLYDMQVPVFGQTWTPVYTQGCVLSTCCPYSKFYTTAFGWYSTYYSPAVCPKDYHTCDGPVEVQTALAASETVKFCCPKNYLCPLWSGYSICESALSTSTVVVVMDLYDQTTVTVRAATPAIPNQYQYAYPLQIRWKEGDFQSTPAVSTNIPKPTPGSPTAVNHGLTKGAIIAIALVLGVFAIIMILAAIWFLRRKAKLRQGPPEQADTKIPHVQVHELRGNAISELS